VSALKKQEVTLEREEFEAFWDMVKQALVILRKKATESAN